jgi:hypothetical protein
MADYKDSLNATKALIWRIVHRDNVPWILDNGLHCGSSELRAPNWVSIGNPELIDKRAAHPVPVPPGGFLNDYVPFYFTPFSPMLRNINTGRGGIQKRPNDEIVILVSSLHRVAELGWTYLFTDSHAYYKWASFHSDLSSLDQIDWTLLQRRDFKRDPDDPGKFERYQAEALVHRHLPVEALVGVVCYADGVKLSIDRYLEGRDLKLSVIVKPGWYFS